MGECYIGCVVLCTGVTEWTAKRESNHKNKVHFCARYFPSAYISYARGIMVPCNQLAMPSKCLVDYTEIRGYSSVAFLRHWVNGNTVTLYELGEAVIVGRAHHCHIRLDDRTVSAEHLRFTPLGKGRFQLEDLNSTNGVLVNGDKVTSSHLKEGDVIFIGTHEFEYLDNLPNDLDKTQKIKKSWIPGLYYTVG